MSAICALRIPRGAIYPIEALSPAFAITRALFGQRVIANAIRRSIARSRFSDGRKRALDFVATLADRFQSTPLSAAIRARRPFIRSVKPGKLVPMARASSIVTVSLLAIPRTRKAIAIR